jgi:hypothetical protein
MGGHGVPGWRWLDLRKLSQSIANLYSQHWPNATVDRVVYCTATIKDPPDPQSQRDQDTYLRALRAANAVDHIEYGHYVSRVIYAPLATKKPNGEPRLVEANWPIRVKDHGGAVVPQAQFMASVAHREEKGTDVNLASHLLLDAIGGRIDAAIVISNDSDLAFPVAEVRKRMPLGMVNPSKNRMAGVLQKQGSAGPGLHWGRRLDPADLLGAQMPSQVGPLARPAGW